MRRTWYDVVITPCGYWTVTLQNHDDYTALLLYSSVAEMPQEEAEIAARKFIEQHKLEVKTQAALREEQERNTRRFRVEAC